MYLNSLSRPALDLVGFLIIIIIRSLRLSDQSKANKTAFRRLFSSAPFVDFFEVTVGGKRNRPRASGFFFSFFSL